MNELKKYIKAQWFDYKKPISIDTIHKILVDTNQDCYIEWLTSSAGEWDMGLYLDYYDTSIDAIVLITEMKYSYGFDNDNDLYEFMKWLIKKVEDYKKKLSLLKKFFIK